MSDKMYFGWAADPEYPVSEDEWLKAYAYVLIVALVVTQSRPAAEELRQDVFENIRTVRRWDPSRGTFKTHAGYVVRLVFLDQQRKRARRGGDHVPLLEEVDTKDDDTENGDTEHRNEPKALDALLDGDDSAERRAAAQRYLGVVRDERLSPNDRVGRGVIDCTLDGIDDAEEQAKRLQVSVSDIHAARLRIRRHAQKLHREYIDEGLEVE